ncbi:hypothetical protein AB1Y20_023596 [Prymnesium parvum]|uniref:Glycoside hydrolase family 38 central domain-containing protein n=1 Tax=Prymnesium parvum TaxID=97485 RepID=A0AB34JE54_PRYPA
MAAATSAPRIIAHVVPHTHTDPGWLATYDEYYPTVRAILDSVTREMLRSPNRTFVWAETCFFARWYADQPSPRRAEVHALVAAGRLEFVGGGWVQHDEALCAFPAILDAMAEGHAWLRETLRLEPRTSWQLDPFGHSASSAGAMLRMGLREQVINRVHFRLKARWKAARHLEFYWRTPGAAAGDALPLAHVLHTHYSSPNGFDFEGDSYNRAASGAAAGFCEMVALRARAYRSEHVMLLVGDDFRWRAAGRVYEAWEQLIREVHTLNASIQVLFSTPSAYFSALRRTAVRLPHFTGDLLPYADGEHTYWTGFFGTRPSLKRLVRRAAAAVHLMEWMHATARAVVGARHGGGVWAAFGGAWFELLVESRRAVAIGQHHDAITGTSMPRVIDDFSRRLSAAIEGAHRLAACAAALLLSPLLSAEEAVHLGSNVSQPIGRQAEWRVVEADAAAEQARRPCVASLIACPSPPGRLAAAPAGSRGVHSLRHLQQRAVHQARHWFPRAPMAWRVYSSPPSRTREYPLTTCESCRCESIAVPLPATPRDLHTEHGVSIGLTVVLHHQTANGSEAPASARHRVGHFHACVPPMGWTTVFSSPTRGGHAEASVEARERSSGGGPSAGGEGGEAAPLVLEQGCLAADLAATSGMLRGLRSSCGGGARELRLVVDIMGYRAFKSGAYIMRTMPGANGDEEAHSLFHPQQIVEHRSAAFAQVTSRLLTRRGPLSPATVRTRLHAAGSYARSVPVVELDVRLHAPPNTEVVLRLSTSLTRGDVLLTYDGMATRQRRRDANASSVASGFFPTAVGFELRQPPRDQLRVLCDRAVGVRRVSAGVVENDNRGLQAPAWDPTEGRLTLLLLWGGGARADADATRLAFGLQAPLLILRAGPAAASPLAWARRHVASFAAVSREAAEPLMLWPRSERNDSPSVLLRVQAQCATASSTACGGAAIIRSLESMVSQPFQLRGLHEVGLSGGTLPVYSEGDRSTLIGEELPQGAAAGMADQEAQNSDEAGVFISDAALQFERKRAFARRVLRGGDGVPPSDSEPNADASVESGFLEARAFRSVGVLACDFVARVDAGGKAAMGLPLIVDASVPRLENSLDLGARLDVKWHAGTRLWVHPFWEVRDQLLLLLVGSCLFLAFLAARSYAGLTRRRSNGRVTRGGMVPRATHTVGHSA